MHPVAHEDEGPEGLHGPRLQFFRRGEVRVRGVMLMVVPAEILFKDKKYEHAREDCERKADAVQPLLECFWYEVHKRVAEKGACGEPHQDMHDRDEPPLLEREEGDPDEGHKRNEEDRENRKKRRVHRMLCDCSMKESGSTPVSTCYTRPIALKNL